jgi:hypothetical protein
MNRPYDLSNGTMVNIEPSSFKAYTNPDLTVVGQYPAVTHNWQLSLPATIISASIEKLTEPAIAYYSTSSPKYQRLTVAWTILIGLMTGLQSPIACRLRDMGKVGMMNKENLLRPSRKSFRYTVSPYSRRICCGVG